MKQERKKTILLVDDNKDVGRLVRKVLEKSSFDVIEARNGEQALEIVEQELPDLILMDIRLPGPQDGLYITGLIKENQRLGRIPIVALTASVLAEDRERALAAGCSGFISKPIDINKLPLLVEKYILVDTSGAPR